MQLEVKVAGIAHDFTADLSIRRGECCLEFVLLAYALRSDLHSVAGVR